MDERNERLKIPQDGPIILAYGMGVDSTAMLVLLKRHGIRPDLIMFADTGGEKRETYAYLDKINDWLDRASFPQITRVKYETSKAPYNDLEGNCLANETLPSLAFGRHSCSLKWKVQPQDYFVLGCKGGPNKCDPWAPAAEALAKGIKPVKLIGYDSSPADIRRSNRGREEDDQFRYVYPLQLVGWTREDCKKAIVGEGLPLPVKSACFFCPASKKWEIAWLAATSTDLFLRAIAMEDGFLTGKWYRPEPKSSVKGLGRTWSWRAWAEESGFLKGRMVDVDRAADIARELMAESTEANRMPPKQMTLGGIPIVEAA